MELHTLGYLLLVSNDTRRPLNVCDLPCALLDPTDTSTTCKVETSVFKQANGQFTLVKLAEKIGFLHR